jgi:hypothetical protein
VLFVISKFIQIYEKPLIGLYRSAIVIKQTLKQEKKIIKKRSCPSSELELAPDDIPRAESSSSVSEFSIFSHFTGLRVSLSLPIILKFLISGFQDSLY